MNYIGIWRHYLGTLYICFGLGVHTSTGEEFVVYRLVEDIDSTIFIRPKADFDSTIIYGGSLVPKFTKLSKAEAEASILTINS